VVSRRTVEQRRRAEAETRVVCETETDARLLAMILGRTNRSLRTYIQVAERPLIPQMLFSPLGQPEGVRGGMLGLLQRTSRNYGQTVLVFDLDFGSPIQPAPYAARISDIWLAPAVPSVASWVLADQTIYDLMAQDRGESIKQTFESYVVDNRFHFFNSKFLTALGRKIVEERYDPHRAAMVSPSLRGFLKTLDLFEGVAREDLEFSLPGAILANLVLEYYPSELPIYRALDGSVYTGADMAKEMREGTPIGRGYSSDLLRACRDLLARQAQNVRAAE
jgi:hypothetical protein